MFKFFLLRIFHNCFCFFIFFNRNALLVPSTGNEKKVSSSQGLVDPSPGSDTTSLAGSGSARDDVPTSDSQTTTTGDPSINDDILHQPAIRPESNVPETKAAEKKAVSPDAGKETTTTPKPVIEAPLTDDARDSIYWIGFNAYFDHHPNHFNKSSARYKAWMDGMMRRLKAKKLWQKIQRKNKSSTVKLSKQ